MTKYEGVSTAMESLVIQTMKIDPFSAILGFHVPHKDAEITEMAADSVYRYFLLLLKLFNFN